MKNILQATALIIVAVSAILVVAFSHPQLSEKCNHEWDKHFAGENYSDNGNLNTDTIFKHQ